MDKVKTFGSILGIWAHPDDESFSSAGVMAQAIDNGQRVACVTATMGEKGQWNSERWPGDSIGDIRKLELQQALKAIGIKEHYHLGLIDGELATSDQDHAVAEIARIITAFKPDTVVTFGPDGITGHSDHRTISRWSALACESVTPPPTILCAVESRNGYEAIGKELDKKFNIYFATDQPVLYESSELDYTFSLPAHIIERKIEALSAQQTQVQPMIDEVGLDTLKHMVSSECFVKLQNAK